MEQQSGLIIEIRSCFHVTRQNTEGVASEWEGAEMSMGLLSRFSFASDSLGPWAMARVGGLDSLWLGTLKWSDFQMRIRDSYHRAVRVVLCLSLFPSQPLNCPLLSSRLFNT
jgi:hypothetical protein